MIKFLMTTFAKGRGVGRCSQTYVYEDEPEVDHVKRARFPWQRFSLDIELLELKVGWDWTTVAI